MKAMGDVAIPPETSHAVSGSVEIGGAVKIGKAGLQQLSLPTNWVSIVLAHMQRTSKEGGNYSRLVDDFAAVATELIAAEDAPINAGVVDDVIGQTMEMHLKTLKQYYGGVIHQKVPKRPTITVAISEASLVPYAEAEAVV